jgi:hypothetical protein
VIARRTGGPYKDRQSYAYTGDQTCLPIEQ